MGDIDRLEGLASKAQHELVLEVFELLAASNAHH